MDDILTLNAPAVGDAEFQAEIKRLFAEMEKADHRIQSYQSETERLRRETVAILAQLKVS